jgi:hypothetical protein
VDRPCDPGDLDERQCPMMALLTRAEVLAERQGMTTFVMAVVSSKDPATAIADAIEYVGLMAGVLDDPRMAAHAAAAKAPALALIHRRRLVIRTGRHGRRLQLIDADLAVIRAGLFAALCRALEMPTPEAGASSAVDARPASTGAP